MPLSQESLKTIKNLLVIGIHFQGAFLEQLPAHINVGMIMKTSEDCNNSRVTDRRPSGRPLREDPRLRFAFLTYGDCRIVDYNQFFQWPLGPAATFPPRLNPMLSPPMTEREYGLSMLVTFHRDKPTRMQARLAVETVCNSDINCKIGDTYFLELMLARVERFFGMSLWSRSPVESTTRYVSILRNSKLTLCPSGKNPEQYRYWEAIMCGSIPVIEDLPADVMPFGKYVDPAYGTEWRCLPQDIHRFLKETHAPVLFVKDWSTDLPKIVQEYLVAEDGMQRLAARQADLAKWYQTFLVPLLRNAIFCQSRRYFSQ
eukprot:m.515635 g.515635  ORF g.515635 m.515635 type:complete len:315 (+) comp57463_c0_seq30:1244-2188(+)